MALAEMLCEHCKRRITPAMSLKEINGEVWCNICVDKRREGNKNEEMISDNSCTDIEVTMTQCLKLARWTFLYFAKNEPLSIFEKDSSVWRNDVFGKWRVQDSRVVTVSKERWAFWSFSDGIQWKREGGGSSFDWQLNWTWIDMSWGPNSVKKP